MHKSELHSLTVQFAEKQSEVEGKHALIGNLEDRLTASIEEVSFVHQEMASAAHAHSTAAEVCNILACCLAEVLQLHKSIQQLFSWHICSTLPCNDAITVLDIEQGAGF